MLRQENRALRDENTRLSDLTRMLLSSSAFSTFLDDLGAAGLPATVTPNPAAAASDPARQSNSRASITNKDPNPAALAEQQLQALQEESTQVGMTLLPDETVDLSMLDSNGGNAWPLSGVPTGLWGLDQPQVFAVTNVPDGPAVDRMDVGALSGKPSPLAGPPHILEEAKGDSPVIELLPSFEKDMHVPASTAAVRGIGLDETNPAFALFDDSPATRSDPLGQKDVKRMESPFERRRSISSEKEKCLFNDATPTAELPENGLSKALVERFDRICGDVEAAFQRISRVTSHL